MAMMCNNNACNDFGGECGRDSYGGGFDNIINLVTTLIVLQFLTGMVSGNGCGGNC